MVRDLTESNLTHKMCERKHCKGKLVAKNIKKFAKFKMNQHGTSGTFSVSSILYYHFSRYFDTVVHIPPAIYREMDTKMHLDRVTHSGRSRASRGMIAKDWDYLYLAEKKPSRYRPTDELFSSSRKKAYGIMIKGKGVRYGSEINGARWGSPQNEEFQETIPCLSLRSDSL